jgi:hypothetical protein
MTARRRVSLVWALLLVLTFGSFVIGMEQNAGLTSAGAAMIVAIAMLKVRLIGIHFMDLRSVPKILRGLFEGYLLIVVSVLVAFDVFVKP